MGTTITGQSYYVGNSMIFKQFEPNKKYKEGASIIHNGAIWTAKIDFIAGASFDADDWYKVGISVDEFEDRLDEKLDKTDDADKLYGTDEDGKQTTFEKSDFEFVANKIDEIRNAIAATDTKYPTELAVRTQLDSLSGFLNGIAGDVGSLSDITNSSDKTTIVHALNSLFKMLKDDITVEIKSDGLYITRDDGTGTPMEERFAELSDLTPILQEIQGLHGKTSRLNGYDFGMGIDANNINDSDIQTMLTAYALVQLSLSDEAEIPNFIAVHNLYEGDGGNHLLIFNQAIIGSGTAENPEFPAHWVDNGLDSVSIASNTSLGVVKGSSTDMNVAVAQDGTMSVNGLSTALGTFELVGNKTTEIRDADHATDTKYPTELAVRQHLNSNFDYLNAAKLEITEDADKVYGTDEDGEQVTFDKDTFGKVDTVNGISPDAQKNVQTDYVYETEAEFEADKDNIPVGATVIKLYEYQDNIAGFMVVPDYVNQETTNRISTNQGTWIADRTGWVTCQMYSESTASTWNATVDNKRTFRSVTTPGVTSIIIFSVAKGQTVKLTMENGTFTACGCFFIPPKFIKKELPMVVEKNGSYSLDEVKTAETWIDGKPKYRRCWTGNIVAAANAVTTTQLLPAGIVDSIVNCGGIIQNGNQYGVWVNMPSHLVGTIVSFSARISIQPSTALCIDSVCSADRVGTDYNAYKIWVEYTKLTD